MNETSSFFKLGDIHRFLTDVIKNRGRSLRVLPKQSINALHEYSEKCPFASEEKRIIISWIVVWMIRLQQNYFASDVGIRPQMH